MTERVAHLRDWREFRGISQTELARLVGVTKGEISRLEGGHRRLTIEWMQRISDALQMPLENLWDLPPVYKDMAEKVADMTRRNAGFDIGLRTASPNFEIVLVEGDEMKGTLDHGDLVVVDKRTTVPNPAGLFVLSMNGLQLVRRLQLQPDGKTVRVICDNKAYDTMELDASSLDLVGRVTAIVHKT